jgi:hypothetical protein
VPIKR